MIRGMTIKPSAQFTGSVLPLVVALAMATSLTGTTYDMDLGGDTQLPKVFAGAPLGGTLSPLTPGIRYGVEVTYNFM